MNGKRLGLLLLATAAVSVAGVAYAAIPDSGGVFHACIKKTIADDGTPRGKGELRIIDHDAGEDCKLDSETHIHFNEQGPQGQPGLQGEPGIAAHEILTLESALDSGTPKVVIVSCPTGKKVLGGGAGILYGGSGFPTVALDQSFPIGTTGWQAQAREMSPTEIDWKLFVRVVCATVTG